MLKCTHNSGSFAVCTDKKSFDKEKARRFLEPCLKRNYYYEGREWAYKNVKPRILAEKYMDSLGKPDSLEYKITCMGGRAFTITVCSGIAHATYEHRHNDNFSRDWKRQEWYARYKPTGKDFKLTDEIKTMITLSEQLSKGIPQVRVDWYCHEGQIYFGEFTFYTWGGWPCFTPEDWDERMGSHFILPPTKYVE